MDAPHEPACCKKDSFHSHILLANPLSILASAACASFSFRFFKIKLFKAQTAPEKIRPKLAKSDAAPAPPCRSAASLFFVVLKSVVEECCFMGICSSQYFVPLSEQSLLRISSDNASVASIGIDYCCFQKLMRINAKCFGSRGGVQSFMAIFSCDLPCCILFEPRPAVLGQQSANLPDTAGPRKLTAWRTLKSLSSSDVRTACFMDMIWLRMADMNSVHRLKTSS
ncbi:hypothetical protein GOP47_0009017 [Adiantum capillus-veneris]|uniref:Uncharacterized protein n=1 Tax=Adiantum capillus-veneris TaxID=13818 RepID=A0A9D4V085_ADICA|nr:hypothetical protein GOP47_0009017 [Adiantum capillus-veneris]